MFEILKSIILFGVIFSVVFFGGKIFNLSPIMIFISASLLVFGAIGFQAINAIKKNGNRERN